MLILGHAPRLQPCEEHHVSAGGPVIKTQLWVSLVIAILLPAGIGVAQTASDKPENAFLKRIADAAQRNDVVELVSTLHPDVIASFGKEKCSEALAVTPKPGLMVIGGSATRMERAFWRNAQGRTQMLTEGTPFKGGVGTMERGKKMSARTVVFDFVKGDAGEFHLLIDCNQKLFEAKK